MSPLVSKHQQQQSFIQEQSNSHAIQKANTQHIEKNRQQIEMYKPQFISKH